MTDQVTFYDEIEAYCSRLSCRAGEALGLHVSTRHGAWSVTVERWGARGVQGAEAAEGSPREQVWSSAANPGSFTPAPADADANGCRWPVSIEIPTEATWRSGFYLVTVTLDGPPTDASPDRAVAYAGFVVRPASADMQHSTMVVCATNTWNAYNIWGGKSLYTGGQHVSFRRPFSRGMLMRPEVDRDDRKARPHRWGEEHDVDGELFQQYRHAAGYPAAIGSTGWFAHERRFVEWAEACGWEFDLCVSSDLEEADCLDGYDVLIDVGHDEYWSAPQRDCIEEHVRSGGQFASFSGNTCFWQVRLEDRPDGDDRPDAGATMVCHKYSAHETDPVVADGRPEDMSGLWCDPLVGRPEWSLLGAGSAFGLYNRFGKATPKGSGAFTVYRHDHWMFAETDLRYGDLLGADHGAVGYETVGCPLDFDDYQLPIARAEPGLPADLEIVAFTPSANIGVGEYPASISALSDQGDLEFMAERRFGRIDEDSLARCRYGNATMSVCRPFAGGGEVVVVGTTDWVFGLADDPLIGQVTTNILERLAASNG